MINLEKINLEKCQPPPLRRPSPAPYFHPLFLRGGGSMWLIHVWATLTLKISKQFLALFCVWFCCTMTRFLKFGHLTKKRKNFNESFSMNLLSLICENCSTRGRYEDLFLLYSLNFNDTCFTLQVIILAIIFRWNKKKLEKTGDCYNSF